MISILNSMMRSFSVRRLRMAMRGYRALVAKDKIDSIEEVRASIEKAISVPPVAFGAPSTRTMQSKPWISVAQYLMIRIGGSGLSYALLRQASDPNGKVIYPMPRQLQVVVEDGGFAVAKIRCTSLWAGYIFAIWSYGIFCCFKEVARAMRSGTNSRLSGTAFFYGLARGNIASAEGQGRYDIVSWYAGWDGRSPDITAVSHSVDVPDGQCGALALQKVSGPIPALRLSSTITFMTWAMSHATVAGIAMLSGRWWHAFLLAESAKSKVIELSSSDSIASQYLFSNSNWLYRPLWTYAAEAKGAEILLYFYSTNCETPKRSWGYPPQTGSWSLGSWPLYLVWDDVQASFVRRNTPQARIQVVGPIHFSDSFAALPAIAGPSIALFDIQPFRESRYRSFAGSFDLYVPSNCEAFLKDVNEVAFRLHLTILWKRKRDIGKILHPRYRRVIAEMDASESVAAVDPSIAAYRVVQAADLVISMPFTSTALIGRFLGKPSCYYDPLALLQPDDRASHGIPLIQSRSALWDWIAANTPDSNRVAEKEIG